MSKIIVKSLTQTSPRFPAQWEGETRCGNKVLIHYRWGRLRFSMHHTLMGAAALAVDGYHRQKEVGTKLDAQMTTPDMMRFCKDIIDFRRCTFNPDEWRNYKWTQPVDPTEDKDSFELSTDLAKILEWNCFERITDAQMEELLDNHQDNISIVIRPGTALEIAYAGTLKRK